MVRVRILISFCVDHVTVPLAGLWVLNCFGRVDVESGCERVVLALRRGGGD